LAFLLVSVWFATGTWAMCFYLIAAMFFSAAAIVGAIDRIVERLAKQFPITGDEQMAAWYEKRGGK
jgi:uncharacterized membrane protein